MDEIIKMAPKKIRLYVFLGGIWGVLCLTGILLLFFLHPRSANAVSFIFAIVLLLLLVLGDYFLLCYRLRHWMAIISFLNKANKKKEEETFSFLKFEGIVFSNKMGFKKAVFINRNNQKRSFLLLEEDPASFQKGKVYELSFHKDYLLGYKERGDEKE